MVGRLGEPDVEPDHEQGVDVARVRDDLDDRVELALALAGAEGWPWLHVAPLSALVVERDERRGAVPRARLIGAVAGRQEIDVRPVGIGRDRRLPIVGRGVDRDLARPASRRRRSSALEVVALPGLAGATRELASFQASTRWSTPSACSSRSSFASASGSVSAAVAGIPALAIGPGSAGGSGHPDPEQADDEDGDEGAGQEAESLTGGGHRKPSTLRRRILQRPDRRSLRRGPGPENVVPGRAAS